MKKVILFLLASVAMVSCGSDDGDGGSKRPSSVTIAGGNESAIMNMTYDKGRLSTMTSSFNGAHTMAFTYNDKGKVSNVAISGSSTDNIVFTYDADGKLSSLMHSGQTALPFTWTDATTVTHDGHTIKVDSKGDLVMYDSVSFTRDSGKGAFANVKGIDGLTLLLIDQTTLYYASKKPVKIITGPGISYIMNNTLSGGMLTNATFDLSGVPYTMNITY
ncbi:hypothetical protein [Flavobacterium sp.]|uniref:hypothetical protein n=1 Tax=Flavobacterium sp. TaxID=239 RepID=UPI00121685BD|nr:hypothetical protein [Flavobacterium sp.]RZJ69612.1 MAG: hypothetical protein EOO49_16815 [Flavobacterium sp.]